MKSLEGKDAKVVELKKSKQKENAPLLFNLAEIQNECTKRFKIRPDQTLEIIQNLYEKKLVTYPRTDARVLSTSIAKVITKNLNGIALHYKDEKIQYFIKKMKDEKYSTNLIKTKYVNDSKITDHYAIIPTGAGFENLNSLPELQKNVYDLIVRRFLQIFYPAAEFSKQNITLEIDGENFYANARQCIKEGYLEISKDTNYSKNSDKTKQAKIEDNKLPAKQEENKEKLANDEETKEEKNN